MDLWAMLHKVSPHYMDICAMLHKVSTYNMDLSAMLRRVSTYNMDLRAIFPKVCALVDRITISNTHIFFSPPPFLKFPFCYETIYH